MSDKDLDQILTDKRGDAQVLRLHGHHDQARAIEEFVEEVAAVTAEYRTWLTEREASEYTARSTEWLRARFTGLEQRDLARMVNGKRHYRRLALEHRGNAEAAREAGRRARSA
jgi:NAD-specific glutamate dehydrogenase